jgi:dihydrofolate reductase
MILSAIVAMDRNRVIGYQNQMPWHLSADLKHFKNTTMGHPIIMGRNTYEAIGKPLPGRLNIVITRRPLEAPAEVAVVNSLEAALALVKDEPEAFITGGQQIFQQSMSLVQRLYLTKIEHEFAGDTFFPELDENAWQIVNTDAHKADEKNHYDYTFLVLERKKL